MHPVSQLKKEILNQVRPGTVTIIIGETGCGKTTQVPQYLLEAFPSVGVTQPRRIAAISLAERVAHEQGCEVGGLVGYSVRFDAKYTSSTRLKYLTDGMLLREALSGKLGKYRALVLDEVHERTLQTDLLLGLLKNSLKTLSVALVLMSATVSPLSFLLYFPQAKLLQIPSRTHPLTIHYSPGDSSYCLTCATVIRQLLSCGTPGHVLAFLPGQEDLQEVRFFLQGESSVEIFLLFSRLSPSEQKKIFASTNKTKVILATNLAETSLTIPGLKYVVDSCRVKRKKTVGSRSSLCVEFVSQEEAQQRAGRAGRDQPGTCLRLITEQMFQTLSKSRPPEITLSDLSETVLFLKKLKIDYGTFDFLTLPTRRSLCSALQNLLILGAIDSSGTLTPVGQRMGALPLQPSLSRTLLAAETLGCSEAVLLLVAAFSNEVDLPEEIKIAAECGDHFAFLAAIKTGRLSGKDLSKIEKTRIQLKPFISLKQKENCFDPEAALLKAFVAGHPQNIGICQHGQCKTILGQTVSIHPRSTLASQVKKENFWFVFNNLLITKASYVSVVSKIKREWAEFHGGVLYQMAKTSFQEE